MTQRAMRYCASVGPHPAGPNIVYGPRAALCEVCEENQERAAREAAAGQRPQRTDP